MVRATALLLAAIALGSGYATAAANDSGLSVAEQMTLNPAGQPVITPDQAGRLVTALWTARAVAFAGGSVGAIDALETQAAAEFDDNADTTIYGDPGTISEMTILLARQQTYPAFFLAVIRTHSEGRADRLEGTVFTRSAAGAPWKLAINAVFDSAAGDPALAVGQDGYALPSGPVGLTVVQPDEVYAEGLRDGSRFACYGYHARRTSKRSWANPQRVTRSDYIRPGLYTTITTTTLTQGCGTVTKSGVERALGWLTGTVARSGSSQPPPWLWIGLAGVALVAAAYALLATLGRMIEVPSNTGAATAPGAPRLRKFTDLERDGAIRALAVIAVEAAILFEIVRWLAMGDWQLSLAVLAVAFLWILLLIPPWLRRMDGRASRVIAAAPDRVFGALADEKDATGWAAQIQSVERVSEGPPGVGTLYRQVQRSETGDLLEALKVITAYEPGRRYEVRYAKLWQPQTERYTMEPVASGTRLTFTHELPMSPLIAISGGVLRRAGILRQMQRHCDASLLRLQNRLTGETVAATEATATSDRRPMLTGLRVGLLVMVLTGLLSLGGYALLFGAMLGFLVMAVLLIHELGHFAEARSHGLPVRLPFFIPFVGAAVTMRQMPGDAATHARIALAGPLCGTLAVGAACLAAAAWNAQAEVLFVLIGATLNLLNLVPMSILDGGSILAPISRWISVIGLALAMLLVVSLVLERQFSPLVLVIAGLAVWAVVNRFRQHRTPYYRSVSRRAQLVVGSIWLTATVYLLFAAFAASTGLLAS